MAFDNDEENQARIWNNYADRGFLQSTIDPRDQKGLKCDYIDLWSRYYIKKFVLCGDKDSRVLEIGCGSGRNLFALSPFINIGFGIDIAEKQIRNAENKKHELGIKNIFFFRSLDDFLYYNYQVDLVFTMWVLISFGNDDNLHRMLSLCCQRINYAKRFVFFEQIASKSYNVYEDGFFYKKIRTIDEYKQIFSKVGLRIINFKILNEKGYGPFYRLIYMTRLYSHWPRNLNLNRILFNIDRFLVRRKISEKYTDCVFVCQIE